MHGWPEHRRTRRVSPLGGHFSQVGSVALCPPLLPPQPAALLGVGWQRSLLLVLVAACLLAVGRAMLAVQCESLTYIRLLGVQLASRRRSRLWSGAQFIPLRQLQGIIIHEVGGGGRARTWVLRMRARWLAGRLAGRQAGCRQAGWLAGWQGRRCACVPGAPGTWLNLFGPTQLLRAAT